MVRIVSTACVPSGMMSRDLYSPHVASMSIAEARQAEIDAQERKRMQRRQRYQKERQKQKGTTFFKKITNSESD